MAFEVFVGLSNISAFEFALGLRDYHVILLLIPFAALNAIFRHTKEGYLFSSLLILSIGFIFGPTIFGIKGGIAGELIKQSYGFHLFLSASLGMWIYGIIACRNNPNFYRHAVGAILLDASGRSRTQKAQTAGDSGTGPSPSAAEFCHQSSQPRARTCACTEQYRSGGERPNYFH